MSIIILTTPTMVLDLYHVLGARLYLTGIISFNSHNNPVRYYYQGTREVK